jgi:hypothetical protein
MKLKLFLFMLFVSSSFLIEAQTPFFNEYVTDFNQTCGSNPVCGSMQSAYNSKTVRVPNEGYYSLTIKETSPGFQTAVLMQIDIDGNVVFTKEVASSALGVDSVMPGAIEAAEIADMVYLDGFLYVVGSNKLVGGTGTKASSLSKIDLSGQEIWNTIFTTDVNGTSDVNFIVNDIEIIKDKIYYVGTKFAGSSLDAESALIFGKLTLDGDEIESHTYRGPSNNESLRGLTITPNKAIFTNFDFYIGASGGDFHSPVVLAMYIDGTVGWAGLLSNDSQVNVGFHEFNSGMSLPIKNNNDIKDGDPVLFYKEDLSLTSFTAIRLNLAAPSVPMQAIEVSFENFDPDLVGLQLIDAEVTSAGEITTILNKNYTVDLGQTYVSNSMLGSNGATVTKLIDENSRVNSLFKSKGNDYVIGGIVEEQSNDPSNFLLTYTEDEFCRGPNMLSVVQKEVTEVLDVEYEIENVQHESGTSNSLSTEELGLCPEVTIPCTPPTGLWCEQTQDGTELNWTAVPGALTYTISFYANDGDCCCDGDTGPFPMTIEDIETSPFLFDGSAECYSWTVTAFCPDGTSTDESDKMCFSSDQQDCFAPGDLDCGGDCVPPTDLSCDEVATGIQLDWNDVSGAVGYIVNISPNDEDCCCESELLPIPMTITVSTSEYLFPACLDCFSWTVTTICSDDMISEVSEKMCYSAEEEGCYEPGSVDCDEVCCTDTNDQGCITITVAPACNFATFTLDPACLPEGTDCLVHHIDWTTEINGVNPPVAFPNGGFAVTWPVDLSGYELATYLIGYADLILDNGDTCRIGDRILIGGDGTNNPCASFTDGDGGEQRNSSGESNDKNESKVMDLIHPNPVLKGSSIQLSNLNLSDARNLEVLNMSGIVLLQKDTNRSELVIPTEFASGIYYLKVNTDGEPRIYRFLVE